MTDAELQRWQLYIRQRVLIDPVTGCWLWQQALSPKGYGHATAPSKYGLDQIVHRLSYTVFVGPIPDGLLVRHQCHNAPCCNPAHLLVGTAQDNRDDDRLAGKRIGRPGMTIEQAAEVKRLLLLKIYTYRQIGTMFGVSESAIGLIARGRNWPHILPATTESKS